MASPIPYIGITGIVDDNDIATVRACVGKILGIRGAASHVLMAGVLVSRKTLTHDVTTNRRYPIIEVVDDLLRSCGSVSAWPVVHYNTRSKGDVLATELDMVVETCPSMRGIQLNIVSPDVSVVCKFAVKYPEVQVIIQINGSSLRATGLTPRGYAMGYPGIKHALLDLSGGNGKAIDPSVASRDILEACFPLRNNGVRLGIAGGLGPLNPELSAVLNECLPSGITPRDLSYDAESGVRVPVPDPIEGEPYQDVLDRDCALAYVESIGRAL